MNEITYYYLHLLINSKKYWTGAKGLAPVLKRVIQLELIFTKSVRKPNRKKHIEFFKTVKN